MIRLLLVSSFVVLMSACADKTPPLPEESQEDSTITEASSEPISLASPIETVVATIDGKPLSQRELDDSIAIELFDYNWGIFDLRRQALLKRIEALASTPEEVLERVEILLDPPMPPRLEVPMTLQPALGSADAPIVISVFCNYESSHCQRMQAVYDELHELYGDLIQYRFYDYILAFHANAFPASVVARCANRLGSFEPFHKALWALQDNLDDESVYFRTAKQLGIDKADLEACLDDEEVHEAVRANVTFAEGQRFKNVPVTLINGLYINGPKSAAILSFYIDEELKRLGVEMSAMGASAEAAVDDKEMDIPESNLPLRLLEVEGDVENENGRAWIQNLNSKAASVYQTDARILPGVFLVLIAEDFVVLDNAGELEQLTLVPEGEEESDAPKVHRVAPGNVSHGDEPIPDDLSYEYRGIVAPKGESPLSREWLDNQLMNEIELAERIQATDHQMADGARLVRLEGIEDNEFYKTLGFEEGDVIMRVNNKWVHDQQNDLFVDLQSKDEVSVVFMRKGLPIHYKYVIN